SGVPSSRSISDYLSLLLHCSVLTLLFLFFFYSYGHHRDLHSFPTRRSSDLADLEVHRGLLAPGAAAVPGRDGLRAGRDHRLPGSDRKSTRLNSSHVSISYAVFCLKKKNRRARWRMEY